MNTFGPHLCNGCKLPFETQVDIIHAVAGRQEVTIEVKGYDLELVSLDDAVNLFRNADSLSVNELLAIAYQKMRSRQP